VDVFLKYCDEKYHEEACVVAVLDKICCDFRAFLSTKDLTGKVCCNF
jgi:hypothetical protein